MSGELSDVKAIKYAENRVGIGVTEVSTYFLPLLALLFLAVELIQGNSSSAAKDAGEGLLIVVAASMALVVVEAMRIKVVSIPNQRQLVVYNMFRSYRIREDAITAMSVGNFRALAGIALTIRIVFLSFAEGDESRIRKIPVLASFSGGKESRLLNELSSIASRQSIQCDFAKMIY